jgi:hypothetical protein
MLRDCGVDLDVILLMMEYCGNFEGKISLENRVENVKKIL